LFHFDKSHFGNASRFGDSYEYDIAHIFFIMRKELTTSGWLDYRYLKGRAYIFT